VWKKNGIFGCRFFALGMDMLLRMWVVPQFEISAA
jgi:hypothetical protein